MTKTPAWTRTTGARDQPGRPKTATRRLTGRRVLGLALVCSLFLALLPVLAPVATAADVADPTMRVQQILEDAQNGGTIGLYLKEVGGGVIGAHNEALVFEPASTIKALFHFHAMRQVQDGAVIDGDIVTLARQIANAWGNQIGSCPQPSPAFTDSLQNGLGAMMGPSDNTWTQAVRDFFGDGNIDTTRQTFGMSDTGVNHLIGCGADAVAAPNELTLVDAGKMYEAVAQGYLDGPTRTSAYMLMVRDSARVNDIIDAEAAGLGLSAGSLADFKAGRDSALKAGGYGLSTGLYRSVAGWAEVPFKDAGCEAAPREYVFGAFIDGADEIIADDIRGQGLEVLREPIQAALATWVACEADLQMVDVAIHGVPAEAEANTPIPLTVRHAVRNTGPGTPMDGRLDVTLTASGDCTVDPSFVSTGVPALASGVDQVIDVPVTLQCTDPSFHFVQAVSTIQPNDSDVVDPVPQNDLASDVADFAVVVRADVAASALDISALQDAGLGDLLVGDTFPIDVPLALQNHGDIVNGLYPDPVDVYLEREVVVPAGIVGKVQVGAEEAPATVTVTPDGGLATVFVGEPAGALIEAVGPATLTVRSIVPALAVGETRERTTTFALGCAAPGQHEIVFGVGHAGFVDPHVEDPEPGNDALDAAHTIECVIPVALNIRPGNTQNGVQPESGKRVPVAGLSTEAGEYGLPVTFDAAGILGATTRFGTLDALGTGGGTAAWPAQGVLRDAHEPDDKTKDGDTDRVFTFPTEGSGIDGTTVEACMTGAIDAPGGPFVFLGCDTVQVLP